MRRYKYSVDTVFSRTELQHTFYYILTCRSPIKLDTLLKWPVFPYFLRSEGLVALTTLHPLSAKVGTNFADRRRSLASGLKPTELFPYFYWQHDTALLKFTQTFQILTVRPSFQSGAPNYTRSPNFSNWHYTKSYETVTLYVYACEN
jgi:hypothetical protein